LVHTGASTTILSPPGMDEVVTSPPGGFSLPYPVSTPMSKDVSDNPALLSALLTDAESAKAPWAITPYWRTYFERGVRAIKDNGLGPIMTKPLLLKGFAEVEIVDPMPPRDGLKRVIFEAIPKLPVVSKVFAEYRHVSRANFLHFVDLKKRVCRGVLDSISGAYPDARPAGDLTAGGAPHTVDWQGIPVSISFVPFLARAADFYAKTPMSSVTSLMEVGPGLSWSTLAHLSLNPNIRFIINIDIPSTLYISTQFLKATGAARVVDYLDLKAGQPVKDPGVAEGPVVYQLPPWFLDKVTQEVDWLHNSFSFVEMEPAVVSAYGSAAARLVTKGAWLMSSVDGHATGAGGQSETVTFQVIDDAFNAHFVYRDVPMVNLCQWFGIEPENCRLYFKSGD
jgi:putative sugar O-methyltransferase